MQNRTENLTSLYNGQPSLLNYNNNLKCTYVLTGDIENGYITVSIEEFQLENEVDYLDLGEGQSPNNQTSFLVRVTGKPKLKSVTSSTNKMWLFFRTDSSGNDGGFLLQLSSHKRESKF